MTNSNILILYSGGMDSTACVLLLARQHARIRLLTCFAPYIMGARGCTAARIRAMQRACPGVQISQTVQSHFQYVRELHPLRAVAQTRSSLLFCTACKMAMHLKAIEVCCREKIPYASSGVGVSDQQDYPDQLPELEEKVDSLYAEAGIQRLSPLKNVSKKQVEDVLAEPGLLPKYDYPHCGVRPIQGMCWALKGPLDKTPILDWYDSQLPYLKQKVERIGRAYGYAGKECQ